MGAHNWKVIFIRQQLGQLNKLLNCAQCEYVAVYVLWFELARRDDLQLVINERTFILMHTKPKFIDFWQRLYIGYICRSCSHCSEHKFDLMSWLLWWHGIARFLIGGWLQPTTTLAPDLLNWRQRPTCQINLVSRGVSWIQYNIDPLTKMYYGGTIYVFNYVRTTFYCSIERSINPAMIYELVLDLCMNLAKLLLYCHDRWLTIDKERAGWDRRTVISY